MAINLSKGQKISLSKEAPNLKVALVGLGWDIKQYDSGADYDLDASIFLLDANGKCAHESDFIFYNNLSANGVTHSGDNRTGEGDGDDEAITIEFDKVPDYIQKIAVTVTIYDAPARGQNFGQVQNAFVRLVDKQTGSELLRFDLGEDYSTETAIVFAEIYRHNGEWKFSAVGSGFNGGLEALCRQYGLNV
ncbi:TerD family protein [Anaerotruncus colihominis]|uniref:TerD family protein n=1 Tax=Anaerotruncus colihominis TaxID=169435 RepID=A0A845SV24_9FIRM|nr:TerD family protein [Anaerotruncus colihominis]MCR2024777.1 TerD family protein [Anaerotruncus colihominis]NBI78386.1 TerD family protein [Anaerotruncus colihominis]NDO38162.1 TerD family protein [Anaerotruncus colihominis]